MKDFYYILGTERDCTPGELNSAYRKLAQKLQPEGHLNDHFLDSHLQEITEAYQILSDPVRRRKYDTAFKKNYQRRLYYFKIRHLNIAAMLTLLAFTALFGAYVIRVLHGEKTKKPAKMQAAVPSKANHYKKKHKAKAQPVVTAQPAEARPDTAIAPVIKPAPVKAVSAKLVQAIPVPNVDDKTNAAAHLRANVTGVIYLHQSANYRSAVVTTIPNYSQVTILEKNPGFYKVIYNGLTGFVPKWTVVSGPDQAIADN